MSQAALTGAGSTSAANRPAKCLSRDLCARRHSVPIQHQSAPEDLESAVARLIEDAPLPVSGGLRDQSSGWAATLAGSVDTLWIMGLRDEFVEAPMGISMRDEDVVGGDGFIPGAGEDSLFEHLPKMHELLRGGEDNAPGRKALWDHERRKRPEWKPYHPEGFTAAKDPRYIRRPEAIESVFYLYRITGDKAFQTRRGTCSPPSTMRTDYANAAVSDVIVARYPLHKMDYMETSKYFYLVFSTPDVISLDEYVLNTEAHPFRILG
ncbi:hypothetical protein VB005_11398 [Metarhizium brunneum]